MFFIPLVLFSMAALLEATLPDINSFMPNILEMVPFNGHISVNDQVISFGNPSTLLNSDIPTENVEEPRVDVPNNIPNNLPQIPDFESRTTDFLPVLPNTSLQSQNNEQNFDQRSQFPEPLHPFPQSIPISQIPSNFETRIPSLESILSNMNSQNSAINSQDFTINSQNSAINSLPNIGSTEIGSTFARNANSDFADEFSQPPASTPNPFGFPDPRGVQSNLGPTESPLFVMPLVVSPDRLLQRGNPGMSSNPIPIPTLFANDERMSASERVESLPLSIEQIFGERTTNTNESAQVVSRKSTIVLSPTTFAELTNETLSEERNFDSLLDRHVMSILRASNATITSNSSAIPFNFGERSVFTPQAIPTLAQLEDKERQRSQSIPKTIKDN